MKCPGQDSRYWSGEDVFESPCKQCGNILEFFKDDSQRKCKKCGHITLNPKIDFGCASYCPHAEQCLGSLPPELINQQKELFRDQLVTALSKYFGQDERRINHALAVAKQADIIGEKEKADPKVVMAAAYLHDIGIKNSEEKYNSSAPKYQHIEGPPVARQILSELKCDAALIDEVCGIIDHHHSPGEDESINFKVIYDADLIVNMSEKYGKEELTREKLDRILPLFLTESGKEQGNAELSKLAEV